jgi:hypothetical protein
MRDPTAWVATLVIAVLGSGPGARPVAKLPVSGSAGLPYPPANLSRTLDGPNALPRYREPGVFGLQKIQPKGPGFGRELNFPHTASFTPKSIPRPWRPAVHAARPRRGRVRARGELFAPPLRRRLSSAWCRLICGGSRAATARRRPAWTASPLRCKICRGGARRRELFR